MRRGTARALRVGSLVVVLVLAACGEKPERRLASETLLGLEADQVLVGVEMTLTRDGVRRGLLVADTAFSYQEEGRLRLRNLSVTFLDENGQEQGQLRGREGRYDFESGDIRVTGDVEVVEATGSKRLLTERLFYRAAVDSLVGDTAFVLYRPGLEYRGDNFVSDSKLENVEARNPRIESDADPAALRPDTPR